MKNFSFKTMLFTKWERKVIKILNQKRILKQNVLNFSKFL